MFCSCCFWLFLLFSFFLFRPRRSCQLIQSADGRRRPVQRRGERRERGGSGKTVGRCCSALDHSCGGSGRTAAAAVRQRIAAAICSRVPPRRSLCVRRPPSVRREEESRRRSDHARQRGGEIRGAQWRAEGGQRGGMLDTNGDDRRRAGGGRPSSRQPRGAATSSGIVRSALPPVEGRQCGDIAMQCSVPSHSSSEAGEPHRRRASAAARRSDAACAALLCIPSRPFRLFEFSLCRSLSLSPIHVHCNRALTGG